MIEVNALKNQLVITEREQITSGSVNVDYVHFHFNSFWDGLEKIAVFKTPSKTINVPIVDNECVVPWEVTATPGVQIRMGVYGIKPNETILPTIWTNFATVVEGVFIGDAESGEHTPDIYDAILSALEELDSEIYDLEGDILSEDEIREIVENYLKEHPIDVDKETIKSAVVDYLKQNPPTIDEESIQEIIERYLNDNPIVIDEEDINQLIEKYLEENSITVDTETVTNIVKEYLKQNPVVVDDEKIKAAVEKYLTDHPVTVDQSLIETAVGNYLIQHPVETLTREDVQNMINESVGSAINSGY